MPYESVQVEILVFHRSLIFKVQLLQLLHNATDYGTREASLFVLQKRESW